MLIRKESLSSFTALLGALSLALAASGCDQGGAQKGGGKKGGSADGTEGNQERQDGGGTPVKLDGDADFDGWCKTAGETKVKDNDLADLYGQLCNGDKATKFFKTDMLTVVYDGSGDPKFKSIEALSSDKAAKETKYKFAVTIKLPIAVADHFDKVGPRGCDVDSQKKLAEANGATAEVEIKKEYKEDGEHQVRGCLMYSKIQKKAGPITVTTETEARSDQFELEKDKHYMYSSYVTKAVQTVKHFSTLTAGVQAGGDAYLMTVVDVVVNNKGFSAEGEKQLKKTAVDTVKAMYKAAESVK